MIVDIILSRYTFNINMQVIFLAERQCALTVNGAYFGMVDGFEKRAELDPKDGLFCEFLPENYCPVRFRLDEDFLLSPPPHVDLYFFRGGAAIYCRDFVRSDPTLSVLWQKRVGGSLLTLCMQGRLSLNLENETGFHIIPLPEEFMTCTPHAMQDEILLEGETYFAILSREGKLLMQTDGKALSRGEIFKAEIPFFDSMGHTAVIERKEKKLLSCAIRGRFEPTERTFALALFESCLIGADVTPFLADNLREKAGSLRQFLGKYVSVALTDDPTLTGLVYERKPHVFDVRYFRITLEDGKIANIREE